MNSPSPNEPRISRSEQPGRSPFRGGGGRFIVVLDAAHGGTDNGAQLAGGVAEKIVTLAVSVRLRSLLSARGLPVMTTREGDVNLDGLARVQAANHSGAAACLSIHASETGSGVHIFVASLGQTQATRFLAWKTAQSAFVTRSLKLASTLNSAFEHSASQNGSSGDGSDSSGANAGPIPATLARTSLEGVDSMACPAVALEIGPLRDADRKITTEVTDEQYQSQIAETLAAALLEWRADADSEGRPEFRSAGGRLK